MNRIKMNIIKLKIM